MDKKTFDIECENFDLYFNKEAAGMNADQREELPKSLLFKLFIRTGVFNKRSTGKIGFLGKLYILFKAMRKKIFIVVEGDNGMTLKDFYSFKEAIKKRSTTIEETGNFISFGTFIIGGKDLIDSFSYLNGVSNSPAYHYLLNLKNDKNKSSIWAMQREYIVRFLTHYEAKKRTWGIEMDINTYEYYVLLSLYGGRDTPGSEIYRSTFKNSHVAPSKIRGAFSSLRNRGFIEKRGVSVGVTFKITPHGKSVIDNILDRYALNC